MEYESLHIITKYGSTLYIGMDEVLAHYACTFKILDVHFHLMIHFQHCRIIAKVNMYVQLNFGENWTTNMGDMAKSLFLQFFLSLLPFLFFRLNPCISKTVRDTGLNFCTQVESNDPTCSDLSKCL